MTTECDTDMLRCSELLEIVARHLGDPNESLGRGDDFASVLVQSEEVLSGIVEGLRLAVRLGEVDGDAAEPQLAALEEILEPLFLGALSRPDELALLYLRMASAIRALGSAGLHVPASDREHLTKEGSDDGGP